MPRPPPEAAAVAAPHAPATPAATTEAQKRAEEDRRSAELKQKQDEAKARKLAEETAAARAALAKGLEEKAADAREAQERKAGLAKRRLTAIQNAAAEALLSQDFGGLRILLADAEKDDCTTMQATEWRAFRSSVEKVAGLRGVILEAFRADVGKEVTVHLTRGSEALYITGVNHDGIQAERRITAGQTYAAVSRDFRYDDLTTREKLKRLGEGGEAECGVMRALVAWEAKNVEGAKRLLDASDCTLAGIVKARLESDAAEKEAATLSGRKQAREAAAAREYGTLLALACPEAPPDPAASATPDAVAQTTRTVAKKRYTEAQIAAINKALAAFCANHASTDFFKARDPVVKTLQRLVPNIPLVVEADVLERARSNLQKDNPGREIVWTAQAEDDGLTIDLHDNKSLWSIKSLAGLPLKSLDLSRTPVMDLRPLRGMPLQALKLTSCTNLVDLSPLAGMPLTSLDFWGCTKVTDLRPLSGMRLAALNLYGYPCAVSDLAPLRGMPLTRLDVGQMPIGDLSPLAGMPLATLHILRWGGVHPFRSLSPLQGLPLTDLIIESCVNIKDLRPLQGMPLVSLEIRPWQAENSSPLLSDLSPLHGLALTRLVLDGCPGVRDLSPLQGMPLTALTLVDCPGVTDIGPLKGLPLTALSLKGTRVTDLSPLKEIATLGKVTGRDGKEIPVPR